MNEGWESDEDKPGNGIVSQQYTNRDRYRNSDNPRNHRNDRNRNFHGHHGNDHDSRRDDRNGGRAQDDGLVVQIEQSKVGKLIGRGGSKIKELESVSGARINVSFSIFTLFQGFKR